MSEPEERTPTGAPVYRHKAVDRPVELVAHRSAFADRIEEHLEKHIGPAPNALHEIVSDRIHLDLHVCPPTATRDFFVLFTTGVSTRPMKVPPGMEKLRYAELLMALPANWPGLEDVLRDTSDPEHPWHDEENYWPIRRLKATARMPSQYDTWLGYGHTVSAGSEAEPFAKNTRLDTAALDFPAGLLTPDASAVKIDEDTMVFFYTVVPLYPEERDFKVKNGANALFELFDKEKIGPVIDPHRRNVCAKKKRWGLF